MSEQQINDGGPAFPLGGHMSPDEHFIEHPNPGMSLRDYFAGQALVGLMPENGWTNDHPSTLKEIRRLSANAHKMADAMIAKRNRRETE